MYGNGLILPKHFSIVLVKITMKIGIIFPHQLYENTNIYEGCSKLYLIEEYLFFRQYPFHKQKIAFHRASMKCYEAYLKNKGFELEYIESISEENDIRKLIAALIESNPELIISYTYNNDQWLEKRIKTTCQKLKIQTVVHDSQIFITHQNDFIKYAASKNKLLQNDFYIATRKRLNILLQGDQPEGGKWSFDEDNRLKYPTNKKAPITFRNTENKYLNEAYEYVEKHFVHHHGNLDKRFSYAVSFEEAKQWLQKFLEERFREFGTYEDAIVVNEYTLHHSVISPLLNVGLLNVEYVIKQAISYASEHQIAINQLEGFIRQIIGWREFINGVYEWKGVQQRNGNFFKHHNPMPKAFYNGTTGIAPIDQTILKLNHSAYNHHIERLMVLSNFMLLCEISPNAIYQWFMEMYIDAYDWVMVPNIYGMGQFADGGLMCTKPYISSSNYILKMSNYGKGPWTNVWDALFWRFMNKNREYLSKNFRLGMLIKTYDKMDVIKKKKLDEEADIFLLKLHSNEQK
jgi:deoxyribodipyrimidine photolyase-related protein